MQQLICWLALAIGLVALSACSGPQLPFAKDTPAEGDAQSIIKPPWEAYIQAPPGAGKDIDLETLNGPLMQPPNPSAAATDSQQAATPPAETPEPAEQKDGALHFAAVPPVTGADSTGNDELTAAMREVLKEAGWPVLKAKRADALTITGHVTLDPPQGGQQVVHLVWAVATPAGKKLGDIKQDNTVPAGTFDGGWGDNARYAAEAAAEGIFKLIRDYR